MVEHTNFILRHCVIHDGSGFW